CLLDRPAQMAVPLAVSRDGIVRGFELASQVAIDRPVIQKALAAVEQERVGLRTCQHDVLATRPAGAEDGADFMVRLDEELEGTQQEINGVMQQGDAARRGKGLLLAATEHRDTDRWGLEHSQNSSPFAGIWRSPFTTGRACEFNGA